MFMIVFVLTIMDAMAPQPFIVAEGTIHDTVTRHPSWYHYVGQEAEVQQIFLKES